MYYIHSIFQQNVLFLVHLRLRNNIICWDDRTELCKAHSYCVKIETMEGFTNKMNNSKPNLLHVSFQNLLIIKDSNQSMKMYIPSFSDNIKYYINCQNQHRIFKMLKTFHLDIIKMKYD